MASAPHLCGQCLRALRARRVSPPVSHPSGQSRSISRSARLLSSPSNEKSSDPVTTSGKAPSRSNVPPEQKPADPAHEPGPMARRLEEATEDALLTGGRAGRRAVEDAGFSEELKTRLLDKIADAQFRTDNATALFEAGLGYKVSNAAGQGTRAIAGAQPWTGDEAPEDTILRMLDDAHKPLAPELRGKPRVPAITPRVVDMRLRREPTLSPGQKAASARDRATVYSSLGLKEAAVDTGLSPEEKDAMREEFRERFRPGARAMPNTVTGLAALANERIENAIARGQFKNIPRGKGVERDTRADNPFIDTTEYIMNKMIQRQDIVPPWIEKQQDLVKTANVFRARLRNDWKRHAARTIASQGGSLQEHMRRATEYARAEEVHNPRRRNVDQISVASNATDDVVMMKIRQPSPSSETPGPSAPETTSPSGEPQVSLTAPFRDPTWEATERSYMELAIANLNAMTRSYNLMAPELAKKPYFSLERELQNCFADVAPLLAETIKERAARPAKSLVDTMGQGSRGVLDRLGIEGSTARVHDSKAPHYGLKEMWRDFWSRPT